MAIINTKLQLRGVIPNYARPLIEKINVGMPPLPIKGAINGNSIEITGLGKGNLEVSTTKVNTKHNKTSSKRFQRTGGASNVGGNLQKTRKRRTNLSQNTANKVNKNGKKAQKRVNGRFSK